MDYFGKAKTAKEMYANAQEQEELDIAKMTNNIDSYVGGYREQIMVDKDEYLQLKNTVEKMKNSEVVLDIITPSNNECKKVGDLPNGFTKENSIIVGGYFSYGSGTSYQINCSDFEAWSTATMIQSDGIYMRVDYSGFENLPGKIVLKKII